MEVNKFSEKSASMDEGGTLTIFLSEKSCLKMSPADIIGAFQRLMTNKPCREHKIPPRVVGHITGQINSISGFVDAMMEDAAKETQTETEKPKEINTIEKDIKTVKEVVETKETQPKKRKTGPRVSKNKRATLLSFLKQFVLPDKSEEFDHQEIFSLIGNVQIKKVIQFMNNNGFNAEETNTGKIKVSLAK